MNFPSPAIENAVNSLASFPGIGKKTALRMVLHLLKQKEAEVFTMADFLKALKTAVNFCERCGHIAEKEGLCNICKSAARNGELVCVVKDFQDVLLIENTGQFRGKYHVLGGLLNPIEGIGPDDISIAKLLNRVADEGIKEVVIALSASMEGDQTSFYLARKLQPKGIAVSAISRGIAVGGELEFADEVTLGRSIADRVPYKL